MDPDGDSPSGLSLSTSVVATEKKRSRKGCLTCRQRRIKCDEIHPTCGRCLERDIACEWPTVGYQPRKIRRQRPVMSCEGCRQRRVKCGGTVGVACEACSTRRVECVWLAPQISEVSKGPFDSYSTDGEEDTSAKVAIGLLPERPSTASTSSSQPILPRYTPQAPPPSMPPPRSASSSEITGFPSSNTIPTFPPQQSQLDIQGLVRVYFATAHYFGFTAFIHEGDYWDRYENGDAPEDLTLLMAAQAVRFGGRSSSAQELEQADSWVAQAGDRLLSQVMREFGAIELMIYDFLNGRYSRGFVVAGMAVRMMTFLRLHVLDESLRPTNKPLLRTESLRRLAWAIWFLDATIDGGNSGFSAIREGALTIKLPCDERSFLLNVSVPTEPLLPPDTAPSPLGLGAHLIRAMAARQELAEIHSLLVRHRIDTPVIEHRVRLGIIKADRLLDSLPPDMAYTRVQYLAYKDQLPLLVSLHVMRNTCRRHIALLEILASANLTHGARNIPTKRQNLIDGALELSGILKDALTHRVVLDPQIAMHAYNGIETLLFQPLRQMMDKTRVAITKDAVLQALNPFVKVIRDLAQTCELVNLIYPEAINRMIQFGYVDGLTEDDMMAVLKKVHCLANAEAEFDFQESFWRYELSLNRRQANAHAGPDGESPNNALLEIPSSTSPSFRSGSYPSATLPAASIFAVNPVDSAARLQTFLANCKSGYNTPAIFGGGSPGQDAAGSTLPSFTFDDIETLLNADGNRSSGGLNRSEQPGDTSTEQVGSLGQDHASNEGMSGQMPFPWSFWDGSGSI